MSATLGGQLGDGALDGRAVAHVERDGVGDGVAQLVTEGGQPLGAAAGGDQPVPLAREALADGGAEPGGRSGHEDDHGESAA